MESTPYTPFNLLIFFIFITITLSHLPPDSSTPLLPKAALPTKSGYLKVNSTTGSSIFYTFYEAQNPTASISETPLLIWLQGGPGCSSMIGNFYELGPWRVSSSVKQNVEQIKLEPNSGSWNRIFGLVFLDNPIGVGFSIASTTEEIPKDQNGVAKHLYTAIKKFIALNPLFKSRPLYITGESYAGKYVPAIGYHILKRNDRLPFSSQVNLAGVAIGNGLTDPITQVATHALSGYYSGFLNEKQKTQLEKLQQQVIELVREGTNWSEATNARNRVLDFLRDTTGLATLYDFRRLIPYRFHLVTKFLQDKEVKLALRANVSIVYDECSDLVGRILHEDVMKSMMNKVEYLVKKSKVLLYQGQCDLQDGVVSVEAWVKKMKWDGINEFLGANREVWKVEGKLAGYVQKWGSLSNVVVAGSGHLVPHDQSVNSQVMIENWVLEKGLFSNNERIEVSNSNFRRVV